MTSLIALDTSVALPLLVQSHRAHAVVVHRWKGRDIALSGHAVAETCCVLTRLPGDARLHPADAARLLTERFAPPPLMAVDTSQQLPNVLASLGIAGGAVYDAMVAIAAAEHHCVLATRDARAKTTYDTVGVQVEIVALVSLGTRYARPIAQLKVRQETQPREAFEVGLDVTVGAATRQAEGSRFLARGCLRMSDQ